MDRSVGSRTWSGASSGRRGVVTALVGLGVALLALALFGLLRQAAAQPHPLTRTPLQIAHVRLIVASLEAALGNSLRVARRFGRPGALEQAANGARGVFVATLSTDPYAADERSHLEQAQREVDSYLAGSERSHGALSSRYGHIEDALKALEKAHKSVMRDDPRGQR